MRTIFLFLMLLSAARAEPVTIAENERVVHLIGTPFTHAYYEPRLGAMLLHSYAERGLVYRPVNAGRNLADLLRNLEAKVFVHRPTLVIVQCGIDDLLSQSRQVEFDFQQYPKSIETLVDTLRKRNVKVILCSPTPLPTQLEGLKSWEKAARETAARHGAAYADLFTEAVDWKMIGSHPKSLYQYDPDGHRKSWELFLRQVQFDPPAAEPATISPDLKALMGHVSGHVTELEAVETYKLPSWIKLADYEEQKERARQSLLNVLVVEDLRIRYFVTGK